MNQNRPPKKQKDTMDNVTFRKGLKKIRKERSQLAKKPL